MYLCTFCLDRLSSWPGELVKAYQDQRRGSYWRAASPANRVNLVCASPVSVTAGLEHWNLDALCTSPITKNQRAVEDSYGSLD
jgi:hypothetical protein